MQNSSKPYFKYEDSCTEKLHIFHKGTGATISGISPDCLVMDLYYNFSMLSH